VITIGCDAVLEDVDVYVPDPLHPFEAAIGHLVDERIERHVLVVEHLICPVTAGAGDLCLAG
jgi:hypothetical protein